MSLPSSFLCSSRITMSCLWPRTSVLHHWGIAVFDAKSNPMLFQFCRVQVQRYSASHGDGGALFDPLVHSFYAAALPGSHPDCYTERIHARTQGTRGVLGATFTPGIHLQRPRTSRVRNIRQAAILKSSTVAMAIDRCAAFQLCTWIAGRSFRSGGELGRVRVPRDPSSPVPLRNTTSPPRVQRLGSSTEGISTGHAAGSYSGKYLRPFTSYSFMQYICVICQC